MGGCELHSCTERILLRNAVCASLQAPRNPDPPSSSFHPTALAWLNLGESKMSRRCPSPLKLELWIHLQICFAFSFFLTRGASEGRNLNRDQQNWRSVILNWGSTAELKPTKTCSCYAGMTFAKNTVFQNMLKIRSKWHSLTPWELSVMTGFSIDKNCGLSVTGASKAGFSICQCGQAPQTACQPTWAATSVRLWIFWIWASNGRMGRGCVWCQTKILYVFSNWSLRFISCLRDIQVGGKFGGEVGT